MKEKIKSAAMDFLTGILVTVLAFVITNGVTYISEEAVYYLEFPVMTCLFFFGSLYRGRKSMASPAATVLLMSVIYWGFFIAMFAFGILTLKSLFLRLALLAFPVLGVYLGRNWNQLSPRRRAILATVPLIAVNLVLLVYIPFIMTATLTHEYNEPAPPFEFSQFDGGKITADSVRGKVVVLDFWSTWCTPCIKEFPHLQQLYDKYKNHPKVLFFAVNADQGGDTLEKAKEFVSANGYQMPFAYDFGSRTFEAFEIRVLPGLVILDKSGNLRFKRLGYVPGTDLVEELSKRIEALLKEG
jgi:thiol-disulfide isomerase/thioredoxin